MPLTRGQKTGLGITVAGLGFGGAAYYGSRYLRGKALAANVQGLTVALNPTTVPASGATNIQATMPWTNGSKQSLTYVVQAAIVELVGSAQAEVAGHMFATAALANEAEQLADSGQSAAALQMVTSPQDRLTTVQVAPGAQGTATLYGLIDPSHLEGPFDVAAWVEPAPLLGSASLLVQDSTGTLISVLASPVAQEAEGSIGVSG